MYWEVHAAFHEAGRGADLSEVASVAPSAQFFSPVRPSEIMNTEVEPGQGGDNEVSNEEDVFEEKENNDDSGEAVDVKIMKRPEEPTQDEIDKHMCTHIPFRSWCSHCVMGKAKNNRHEKRSNQEMRYRSSA